MYLEHFGLRVNPFGISPRLDFLFKSGAFEEGMAHLMYGLENSEAIVMITGAIGTGKTMAVQSFLSYLGDRYLSALVTNTCVDGRELLKLILDDLDRAQPPGADKSDLLIAFKQFLIGAGRDGRKIIVVIDEAQNLSREVLEEVRLLTNMGQGEAQPVQIILVGQPELEATVNRADLAQLRQRIRVHCRLTPLTREELGGYVGHRLQVAGGEADVFSRPALDVIFSRSGGVPRVVNTLCDQALLSAFVAGRSRVEAADVPDEAALPVDPVLPRRREARAAPAPMPMPMASQAAPETEPPTEPAVPPRRPTPATGAAYARPRRSGRGRRSTPRVAIAGLGAVCLLALVVWRWDAVRDTWSRVTDSFGGQQEAALVVPGDAPARQGDVAHVATSPDMPAVADTGAARPAGDEADDQVAAVPTAASQADSERDSTEAATMPASDESAQPPRATEVAVKRPVTPGGEAGTAPAAADVAEVPCFLHVSSFRTEGQAKAVADGFASSGHPAVVHRQTVRDVLWFRVYLGPFGGHDAAVELANRLRGEGRITYYKVIYPGTGGEL